MNSSVTAAPPTTSRRSTMQTDRPALARYAAQVKFTRADDDRMNGLGLHRIDAASRAPRRYSASPAATFLRTRSRRT
jgi:hypothetical protein